MFAEIALAVHLLVKFTPHVVEIGFYVIIM